MIKAEIIGGEQVLAYLGNIYPRVLDATKKSITASLLDLARYVMQSKLSGQVLKNQTGRLRRSIHASDVAENGGVVEGTVGTNVEYAAPHEYGFNGEVTVKAYMRKTKASYKASLGFSRSLRASGLKGLNKSERIAFARSSGGGAVMVRSHSRHVNLPERSFLRSALRELAPQFVARLQEDVNKALK